MERAERVVNGKSQAREPEKELAIMIRILI
jgi:hypothetical protein